MKNKHLLFCVLTALSAFLFSCSKSDNTTPPAAVAPKLVKEVKSTETANGTTDINTLVFEYNEKNQLIKRFYKESPASFTTYTYSGDLPLTEKIYINNNLYQETANPIQVNGNIYTMLTVTGNASGSKDSVFVQYTFDNNEITQFRVLIKQPVTITDMKTGFIYSGGALTGGNYISTLNGQQSVPSSWAVKKSDDKTNPYLNAGRVNKTLMSIGQDPLARGKNNIQEIEVTEPAGGGTQTFTHTYDADGYALTTISVLGTSTYRKEYTYTR